ncbi:MAG: T9SS type A sorting domain-containing protein [Bacteroidota bacterium]
MKLKHVLTALFLFSVLNSKAQFTKSIEVTSPQGSSGSASRSMLMQVECAGLIQPDMNTADWNLQFLKIEDEGNPDPELLEIKNAYPPKTLQSLENQDESVSPLSSRAPLQKGAQFDANLFDGSYPPDNAIAVSKDGYIVTAVNSNIRYYTSTGQLKGSKSFESFVNDNTLNSILYDPKVIYDSGSDRFFLCMLHGFTSGTSYILCFVSKTTNPVDGWFYYKIKVSNSVAGRWADFPNIGVSNNERYVTVILFDDNDCGMESVFFQMTRAPMYAGGTLNYLYWSNIKDNQNQGSFTLVPCSYGQTGNYGPGIILCGVRSAGSGNKIQLYDLTADIGNNPQLNGFSTSVTSFQIGSNALQPGTSQDLDVGDCRMKHAFFLNNIIHCAFTAAFDQNGYNGIYYARVNLNPLSASIKKFGKANVDIAYPAMVSFTNSQTDKSVLFMYELASTSVNPGIEVVECDDNMNFGTSFSIKPGVDFIDVEPDQSTYERWGDYGGIARSSATVTPTAWVFGIYGLNNNFYGNNVCEITNGAPVLISNPEVDQSGALIYPNPVVNQFNLALMQSESALVSIDIFDAGGRFVQHLADKELFADTSYSLGFNRSMLPPGTYILNVSSKTKQYAQEIFIVQ